MPFKWMPAQGNLLTLCGGAALSIGPTLDPLTPDGQAFDGRPATPVRFGSKAAAPSIALTMNFLRNPGFEAADLSNWVVLSGTSVRTTTGGEVHAGSASLKFTSADAVRYQDVLVPSGIPITFLAALRGDGTNKAYLVVLNLDTGRFLTGAGAWVTATTTRTAERAANTYAVSTVAATVETFATTRRYLTRLRIHVGGEATATFVDAVTARPSFNFIGLFGHNLTSGGEYRNPGTAFNYYGQVPRYDIDSSEFGWIVPGGAAALVDGATYVVPSPNTWNAFTTVKSGAAVTVAVASDQYAHYPLVTFGELVVGYVEDLAPSGFPISVRLSELGQVRNETPAGDLYAYSNSPAPLRDVTLRFMFNSDAHELLIRDRLYQVSRGGADGVIIVPPTDMVTQVGCIFGVPDQDLTLSIESKTTGPTLVRSASLVVHELPSPQTAAV